MKSVYLNKHNHMRMDTNDYFVKTNSHSSKGVVIVTSALCQLFSNAFIHLCSFPAIGGSTNPCEDIYSGTAAGSEPETQALVNYLLANSTKFDAYLTIHSYGQMWLYPWGFTSAYPADAADLVGWLFLLLKKLIILF